ncbi:hypothetical protein IP87_01560 [beta proteobacterium AAP121]|nr:hypothetical protein IP80_02440 [beta proteobacterium AAP65]KPG00692.1 hypothetical protein IP87_01560 [beta proteobacterium AAP121]
MNTPRTSAAILLAALLCAPALFAGEGHDHGHAAPAATSPALPRFTAESELFELVGVLSGRQITLYLDRYSDNSPVRGAQIELEIGSTKFQARQAQAAPGQPGDNTYEVLLLAAPEAGVLAITATVTAGTDIDLLAGELDIPAAAHADAPAHTHPWPAYAAWGAGGLAALALFAWGASRLRAVRSLRAGGAA